MLHLAETLDFFDVVGEEEHQVLLLELDDLLAHLVSQLYVRVDQDGNFAALFAKVLNHLLYSLFSQLDSRVTLAC